MRTRTFLRTTEFLWQEGHTAHASSAEAEERTRMMLDVYARFAEECLAMPVIKGEKTPSERFPGAVNTYCIEAMMQDRKALQAGTSHFLGQNFAKSSNIRYQTAQESEDFAWTTSWGVSTRLIGGVIMTHGDDDGIIMPPRVASAHVVLLPIYRKPEERETVLAFTENLAKDLRGVLYHDRKITVEIDAREIGGTRGWDWIKKGIPLRVEIGPRDIQDNSVFVARRDKSHKEKQSIKRDDFIARITEILDDIQATLFNRALALRTEQTVPVDGKEDFYTYFTPQNQEKPEIHGGFAHSHWCGSAECEKQIKTDLSVTIRCIPLNAPDENGSCVYCGKPSERRVIFAKSY
jgi:prolyl-tRNA synthetase